MAETQVRPQVIPFDEYECSIVDKETVEKAFKMLFGVRIDDPTINAEAVSDLLLEDRKIVRGKYRLPPEDMLHKDPGGYYDELLAIAKREKISIRNKNDVGSFFKDRLASAVFLGSSNTIVLDPLADSDDKDDAYKKAQTLEHELTHGLQRARFPRMSLLRREYEAYLLSSNVKSLQTKPWLFLERILISILPEDFDALWEQYVLNSQIKQEENEEKSTVS